jgi:arsenate reductase (glutaredoxin)
MTVTIWHNPKCSTSRKVLGIIRARGIEPRIVDYVNAPPSVAAIKAALKAMAMKPRDLLRRRGTPGCRGQVNAFFRLTDQKIVAPGVTG